VTSTQPPTPVAALVRRYRITAGLSQEALAERAGISVRGLSDLERGLSRVPRLETLTRIAAALDLDAASRAALFETSGHLDPSATVADALGQLAPPLVTARPAHNLPGYLTALVGRDDDAVAIERLLRTRTVRLLTLTGPGGVGKTRLAVDAASGLGNASGDGVVYVPLAPVSDAARVLASIAQALGVGERSDVGLFDAVILALRAKRLLLVLDNFEHVLEAAPLVADLLLSCPEVRIMVTSRTLLRIGGEYVYPVRPLALPALDHDVDLTPEVASRAPAVALFLSRAQAVQPGFALTLDNVASVVEVCRELDGLPLALELAAARIAVLPPAELLGRLKLGMAVLSAGPRDAPARHRALRDAIAWSYDLLSPEQQRLFRWLGVFAGGWSLDLAEAVCAEPLETQPVFDCLAALVEHSLVQVQVRQEVAGRPSRFRLLETIREHARERLTASGEAPAAQRRHTAAMLALAEMAEPHLLTRDRESWLRRLDLELDNIRTALAWSLTAEGDLELGQRTAGSLSWFWYLRGHLNEGEQWSDRLIAAGVRTEYTPGSARVHNSRGGCAIMLGKPAAARPDLAEAVRLYRLGHDPRLALGLVLLAITLTSLGQPAEAIELLRECGSLSAAAGHDWFEAYALTNQGAATLQLGHAAAAEELYRRSLELFSALDDPWGLGIALRALAGLAADRENYAGARVLYGRAVDTFRVTGDIRGLAQALLGLAKAALRDGAAGAAGHALREALAYWKELGINAGVVRCLAGLAVVAVAEHQPHRAARLHGAASRFGRTYGVVFSATDRADQQRLARALREELTADGFEAESTRGAILSLEQSIAEALS
jgi:predicted ATPase/transcriptional regulator with XRE-family HTH domain